MKLKREVEAEHAKLTVQCRSEHQLSRTPERPFVQDHLLLVFPFNSLVPPLLHLSFLYFLVIMSETFQELADIPKDFVREGSLFVRRCTKRMSIPRDCD